MDSVSAYCSGSPPHKRQTFDLNFDKNAVGNRVEVRGEAVLD